MNVKKFYEEINGNYEGAIALMMNDAFIARMVLKFYSKNSYNDIIASYENKDFETLFAAVHSFKGVAVNLSFTSLFDIASIITEKTRNVSDVDISEEIGLLKTRYQAFLDAYHNYIEN